VEHLSPDADTRQAVLPRLIRLMVENFELRESEGGVVAETELFEAGLSLDSIDIVELIALVEREFDIELLYEDLEPEIFRTMGSLAAVITARVAESRA
jgi:acyl carrier protein